MKGDKRRGSADSFLIFKLKKTHQKRFDELFFCIRFATLFASPIRANHPNAALIEA
jgi:hypothetical protein